MKKQNKKVIIDYYNCQKCKSRNTYCISQKDIQNTIFACLDCGHKYSINKTLE